MGNLLYNDWNDGQSHGLTFVTDEGSFAIVNGFAPQLGVANTTKCLEWSGPVSDWGKCGFYTTDPITNLGGAMLYWLFAMAPESGTTEAIFSLETAPGLWSTNNNLVSVHYQQGANVTPFVRLYSGSNLLVDNPRNGAEFLRHFFDILVSTGAVRFVHAFNEGDGGTLNTWQTPTPPATTTWSYQGTTNPAQHVNYATAMAVYPSWSFKGASGDRGYIDEFFLTNNGLYLRKPQSPAANATATTTIDYTWTDPFTWGAS